MLDGSQLFAGCPVSRVTGVAGDITLPELGLNPEDRDAVTASVSVVLHSAATVSFQEPLRNAVKLNLEATANVVELARSMKHLAVSDKLQGSSNKRAKRAPSLTSSGGSPATGQSTRC